MSWCNCSSDIGYADTPEFHTKYIHRACNEHKCCECENIIKPGEQYEHVSGKWDGKVSTYKTCLICVSIREHFCPDGFWYGGLDELLFNSIEKNLSEIRGFWLMDEKDKTIASLVELVIELLEEKK